MNYENAPSGSDFDNDEKGFLRYIVSGNTIKVIMHQSGSSSGANQKMGYIIDGVSDAGTHYLVANNNINATDNTGGGGTFPTQSIAMIDARCALAGFAADPAAAGVTDELCHYTNVVVGQANDRYMGLPAATRPISGRPSCSRRESFSWMPREAPGNRSSTPFLCSARRCSSAAFGDLKPIAVAISARVGGMPLSTSESWIILRIWRWRGVRSDMHSLWRSWRLYG